MEKKLGNFNSNLQGMGLGQLVRGAVVLELTRFRYEISFLDTIFGINFNSPEYQTVKPILENTLKRIYQKNKDHHTLKGVVCTGLCF